MQTALFIGLGSFCGGVLRHLGGQLVRQWVGAGSLFPWHTLCINALGCLLLGLLNGLFERGDAPLHPDLRAALSVGLCGGFTTFSTFAGENIALLRQGALLQGGAYMALSLLGGLVLFLLGYLTTKSILS